MIESEIPYSNNILSVKDAAGDDKSEFVFVMAFMSSMLIFLLKINPTSIFKIFFCIV